MGIISLTVAWDVALGADGYEIKWGTDPNFLDQVVTINDGTTTQYIFEDFVGTLYTKIKATGQYTDSLFSPIISGTTEDLAAPQNYLTGEYTQTTFDAEWDAVAEAEGYVVEWGTDGVTFPNTVDVGNVTSVTITGVSSGDEITSRVKAYLNPVESGYSNESVGDTIPIGFQFTVKSDNAGTSANDQFTFPQKLASSPNYIMEAVNSAAADIVVTDPSDPTTFTFPEGAGTYTIKIIGDDILPNFNAGGDKDKLLDVLYWENCMISSVAFSGCSNCTFATATDAPIVSLLTESFKDCVLATFNSSISNWEIPSGISLTKAFQNCEAFNQDISSLNINGSDLSEVLGFCDVFNSSVNGSWVLGPNMTGMFRTVPLFNQPVSNWDTSNVTLMEAVFPNCSAFNQDVSNFDTSLVTRMTSMFFNCTSFDQDLSTFDFTALANTDSLTNFLTNAGLSSANYNALLAKLRSDSEGAGILSGMTLSANGLIATGQGVIDRAYLIENDSMTIVDATPEYFSFTVKSDNPGSSNNDQFTFEQNSATSPDFIMHVVDDTAADIVVTDAADPTTFTFDGGAGTYTILIIGDDIKPRYNNTNDRRKILDISSFNGMILGRDAFYGCENMTSSAIDVPTSIDADCNDMFRSCLLFTGGILSTWNFSGVTDFNKAFQDSVLFNATINSLGTLSPSAVEGMRGIYNGCTGLDQDVSNIDFTVVDNLELCLKDTGLSSANYNAFLAQLYADSIGGGITSGMTLGANGLVATGQGVTDRTYLITNDAMTIIDAT